MVNEAAQYRCWCALGRALRQRRRPHLHAMRSPLFNRRRHPQHDPRGSRVPKVAPPSPFPASKPATRNQTETSSGRQVDERTAFHVDTVAGASSFRRFRSSTSPFTRTRPSAISNFASPPLCTHPWLQCLRQIDRPITNLHRSIRTRFIRRRRNLKLPELKTAADPILQRAPDQINHYRC